MCTARHLRALDPVCADEIELVAQRMRLTLIEVLGEKKGTAVYSLDWLRQRVLWHLDAEKCNGQIFLSVSASDEILGHAIVRVEIDAIESYGLFSTLYVDPPARRAGVATDLLIQGETWMRALNLHRAATNTSTHNTALIRVFERQGYRIILRQEPMVHLSKVFDSE